MATCPLHAWANKPYTLPSTASAQQCAGAFSIGRALYYLSSLIQEQGVRGATHIHRIKLHNESLGSTWSESIGIVFLERSKFTQPLDACRSHFERWLYLLRNLHRLQRLPAKFQEKVFLHLFAVAEIGRFPEAERIRYQSSLAEMERMDEFLRFREQFTFNPQFSILN